MIPLVQTAVCRFLVSTTFTSDMGWETAILGAGTFMGDEAPVPVSRYPDLEHAKAGHKEWVDKITALGPQALPVVRCAWGEIVPEEMRVLDPMTLAEYKEAVRSITPL